MNEVTQVAAVSDAIFMTENIWIMISAMLVFIMGLGFACVEAGLVRAKCAANVAFKNIAVPAIGITMYALLGFGLMYPGTFNGILGFAGFGIGDWANVSQASALATGPTRQASPLPTTATLRCLPTGFSRPCSPPQPRQSCPVP